MLYHPALINPTIYQLPFHSQFNFQFKLTFIITPLINSRRARGIY